MTSLVSLKLWTREGTHQVFVGVKSVSFLGHWHPFGAIDSILKWCWLLWIFPVYTFDFEGVNKALGSIGVDVPDHPFTKPQGAFNKWWHHVAINSDAQVPYSWRHVPYLGTGDEGVGFSSFTTILWSQKGLQLDARLMPWNFRSYPGRGGIRFAPSMTHLFAV